MRPPEDRYSLRREGLASGGFGAAGVRETLRRLSQQSGNPGVRTPKPSQPLYANVYLTESGGVWGMSPATVAADGWWLLTAWVSAQGAGLGGELRLTAGSGFPWPGTLDEAIAYPDPWPGAGPQLAASTVLGGGGTVRGWWTPTEGTTSAAAVTYWAYRLDS